VVICETRSPQHAARLAEAAAPLGVATSTVQSHGRIDPASILALRRELRRGGTDVVHAHGFKGAFLTALSRPRGVPMVSTHHGEWPTEGGRVHAYRAAVSWAYRSGDAVVAVTEATRDRLIRQGIKDNTLHIIENFLHLATAPLESERGLPRDPGRPPTLLFLGRLSLEKGCDVLMDALAHTRTPFVLEVVGIGPEEEALIHRAAARGLAERVRFRGFADDVRPHLADADLLVMPSRTEALPMALIEALCSGLPAVASAVGGVPDVIEDGVTGLLVQPGDAGALARALDRAAEHLDKLRDGVAAAEPTLRERFSAARWARESLALYRGLLAR
jgi:glycosyltransferase involved in cell wall biosynthesis